MKVIALIPQQYGPDKMLVEMDADELGIIYRGEPYRSSLNVGTEIKVGAHWKRVFEINKAQSRLDQASGSLRALADLLETIPVVVPPAEPESAKEGGAK